MSEKQAKTNRKVDKASKADFDRRQKEMMGELEKLGAKYQIGLFGALQYAPNGITPTVAFVDEKHKYEQDANPAVEPANTLTTWIEAPKC